MLFKSCTIVVLAQLITPQSIHDVNDTRWTRGAGPTVDFPQFLDQFTSSVQLGLSASLLVQTLGTVDNIS